MSDNDQSALANPDVSHVTAGITPDKLYLGSQGVVADLVRSFLDSAFGSLNKMVAGEMNAEEVEQADEASAAEVAGVLAGRDDGAYAPVPNWNGAPLARYLLDTQDPRIWSDVDEDDPEDVIRTYLLNGVLLEAVTLMGDHAEGTVTDDDLQARVSAMLTKATMTLTGVPTDG